jgi:hypothetical protein
VRADVERRLDRELQRVLYETLLAQVIGNPLEAGEYAARERRSR